MTKIRCLLVDDEPPAIELLERYSGMIDQLRVVGTSQSAVKAFDLLQALEVDLLFLDIRMPVLSGLDLIKSLSHPPAVILTTAYREYALDGYDLDIIDYLLKPITFTRFLKAVDRYRDRSVLKREVPIVIAEQIDHIFLNINRTHHKVMLSDILHIESLKDYVRIHTQQDRLVVKGNIGTMLKKLPADRFIRIHRSYIVAVQAIGAYNQSTVEVKGQRLPIGPKYRKELLKLLNQ